MNILRYLKELFKSISKNASDLTDTLTWHEDAFRSGLYISYLLYAITFTGLLTLNPRYISILETAIKYYISIILLIRFNPYVKRKITHFDKHLVFEAALLLFVSTTAYAIAKTYFLDLKHSIHI